MADDPGLDPAVVEATRRGEAILKSLNYRCAEKCCMTCGHSDKAYDEIRSCDRLPYARESHGFRGMWVWAWMVCDGWEPPEEGKPVSSTTPNCKGTP